MKESTGKRIKMDGISEMGFKALLTYLYFGGVERICENIDIAIEAILAAKKYNIAVLKVEVGYIFVAKPCK